MQGASSTNNTNKLTAKAPPPPDPIYVLRGHTAEILALRFNLTGDLLFSGSSDGELRVWRTGSRKCLYSSVIHGEGVLSLHNMSNNRLMSQGKDGVCKIWQIGDSNMEVLAKIETGSFSFGKCGVCEESGDIVASPSGIDPSRIEVWDVKSQQVIQSIGTDSDKLGLCMFVRFLPGVISAGYENGKIYWWDLKTGKSLLSQQLHSEPVMCLDVVDSLTHTHTGVSGAADTKLRIFNYNLEEGSFTNLKEISINNPGIQEVKIREDRKIFATAGWDHRVRIYSWKKYNPLAILKYHTESVYSIDFSPLNTPGGPLLASGSKDQKIALWSIYN